MAKATNNNVQRYTKNLKNANYFRNKCLKTRKTKQEPSLSL